MSRTVAEALQIPARASSPGATSPLVRLWRTCVPWRGCVLLAAEWPRSCDWLQAERDFLTLLAACRTRRDCEVEFAAYGRDPRRSAVLAPILGLSIDSAAMGRAVRRAFPDSFPPC